CRSSTVSRPHPLDPRESWSPPPVSAAFVSDGTAPVSVGFVPDAPTPEPEEQLITRRSATTGATREKSSNVLISARTGPSLPLEAEAASPTARDAYHPLRRSVIDTSRQREGELFSKA